jgi:hypothetical protein
MAKIKSNTELAVLKRKIAALQAEESKCLLKNFRKIKKKLLLLLKKQYAAQKDSFFVDISDNYFLVVNVWSPRFNSFNRENERTLLNKLVQQAVPEEDREILIPLIVVQC